VTMELFFKQAKNRVYHK